MIFSLLEINNIGSIVNDSLNLKKTSQYWADFLKSQYIHNIHRLHRVLISTSIGSIHVCSVKLDVTLKHY